jgi:hypothetical protein
MEQNNIGSIQNSQQWDCINQLTDWRNQKLFQGEEFENVNTDIILELKTK